MSDLQSDPSATSVSLGTTHLRKWSCIHSRWAWEISARTIKPGKCIYRSCLSDCNCMVMSRIILPFSSFIIYPEGTLHLLDWALTETWLANSSSGQKSQIGHTHQQGWAHSLLKDSVNNASLLEVVLQQTQIYDKGVSGVKQRWD